MTHEQIDAMPAGGEMDRLIARVAGWDFQPVMQIPEGVFVPTSFLDRPRGPFPSTDLNTAVEAALSIDGLWGIIGSRNGWSATLVAGFGDGDIEANAPSPALAICRAVLKAVGGKV